MRGVVRALRRAVGPVWDKFFSIQVLDAQGRVMRLPRDTWAVSVMTFAFVNAGSAMLGWIDIPGSLEKQYSGVASTLWVTSLLVGSGMALVGMLWPRTGPRLTLGIEVAQPYKVSPVLLEQVGVAIFGASSLLHFGAVLAQTDKTNFLANYDAAFIVASIVHYFSIRRVLNRSRRATSDEHTASPPILLAVSPEVFEILPSAVPHEGSLRDEEVDPGSPRPEEGDENDARLD